MPDVVELRVHGVGGTPAEGLLGVGSVEDLAQVGGEGKSAFFARRADPSVEGYVWGSLTSRLLLQPLFLLLLPFTLLNVAGWMHPPHQRSRGGRFPLAPFRLLIGAIGLGLTVTYVTWTANILMTWVYDRRELFGWRPGPHMKVALGTGLVLAVVGLVVATARMVQAGFEGVAPPAPDAVGKAAPASQTIPDVPGLVRQAFVSTLTAPVGIGRVVRRLARAEGLPDHDFWAPRRFAQALLYLHAGTAVLATLGLGWWAWLRASEAIGGAPESLRLSRFATWSTEALLYLLPLLFLLQLGWRRPLAREEFRWFGPGVVAVTAVGLATGLFYGLTSLLLPKDPSRVAALGTAFGSATLAWAVGLFWLGCWLFGHSREERARATKEGADGFVTPNTAPPGREPNGATGPMYGRLATKRTLSEAARSADLVLTGVQLVFIVTALLQLHVVEPVQVSGFAKLGNYVAVAGASATLFFLIRRSFGKDERRIVGILWDVLTFWPRRFHPLAVRPYAERAVPELAHRLVHHVSDEGRRVILSSHSQGTVLAFATVVLLPDRVTKQVALLTYGSPLRQLHAWAFPAYFSVEAFAAARTRLFDDGREPFAGWRGFYRRTDYIGKKVFGDRAFEEEVPDPAQDPATADEALARPLPAGPDPPRPVWVDLAAHSFYNREAKLKAWVAELRKRLAV